MKQFVRPEYNVRFYYAPAFIGPVRGQYRRRILNKYCRKRGAA
jgi:hypothetical protein